MKKRRFLKKNNAGLSLVELIVAILMTSLIMGMLVTFIGLSRHIYSSVSKDVLLQNEVDYATNYLSGKLMEADGIYFYKDVALTGLDQDGVRKQENTDILVIVGPGLSEGEVRCFFVVFEKANKVLRVVSSEASAFSSDLAAPDFEGYLGAGGSIAEVCGNRRFLLANYVENFSVTTGESIASFSLDFKLDNLDYAINRNVTRRNRIK